MEGAARKIAIAAAVIVAIGILAALYARASAKPEPMKPDEFSRVVRKLASDAREGARLAQALGRQQLTDRYGRAQHEALGKDVSEAKEKLDAPGPGGAEDTVERARTLADRLTTDLTAATLRMSDTQALARIAADETRLAEELERMQFVPQ
jgi:hypothetical protein